MEISLENLYVDIGAQRVKYNIVEKMGHHNIWVLSPKQKMQNKNRLSPQH